MPPWNHVHPLVVHFPIALLLTAPLLVLLGLAWPAQRRGIHAAALAQLGLGVLAAGAALVTGNAATGFAQRTHELRDTLAAHEHYAQFTAGAFTILTALFACLWWMSGRLGKGTLNALLVLWLALSLVGMASLAQTGHLGGRMVHELGTHVKENP